MFPSTCPAVRLIAKAPSVMLLGIGSLKVTVTVPSSFCTIDWIASLLGRLPVVVMLPGRVMVIYVTGDVFSCVILDAEREVITFWNDGVVPDNGTVVQYIDLDARRRRLGRFVR